jgi:hypothetical protein
VGGVPAQVQQRAEPAGRPVTSIVEVAGVQGELVSLNPVGVPNPLGRDRELVLDSPTGVRSAGMLLPGRLQLQLEGLAPDSTVRVLLGGDGGARELARLEAKRGRVDDALAIPTGIAAGATSLVIAATTESGQPLVLSLGARISAKPGTRGTQTVSALRSAPASPLTVKEQARITRLARSTGSAAALGVVQITVSPGRDAATRRTDQVASEVRKALRAGGYRGRIGTSVWIVPGLARSTVTVSLIRSP